MNNVRWEWITKPGVKATAHFLTGGKGEHDIGFRQNFYSENIYNKGDTFCIIPYRVSCWFATVKTCFVHNTSQTNVISNSPSHDDFWTHGERGREFKGRLLESWWKSWALLAPGDVNPETVLWRGALALSLIWNTVAEMTTDIWKDDLKTLCVSFLRCWKRVETQIQLRAKAGI